MAQIFLNSSSGMKITLEATYSQPSTAVIDYETIHSVRYSVCSDALWTISFEDSNFDLSVRHSYQLRVCGKPVKTDLFSEKQLITLQPKGRIFEYSLGVMRLEIVDLNSVNGEVLFSEPFFILIPETAANNLRQMAAYVVENLRLWGKGLGQHLVASDDSSTETVANSLQTLKQRLDIIESVLRLYEQQTPYFRANARHRLIPGERVDGIGRLSGFSESTLRYVLEHPDDLVPVSNGRGLRVGTRQYMPQHALVQTSQKTFNLIENQVVLGFLKTLEKGLSAEIETLAKRKLKLPELLHAQKGYVSSAEAVLGAVLQQLNAYATKISYFLDRAKSIFYQYQQLLPVEPVETITPPLPTQIFLSIPAYRVLYDAILRWYKMDALSVATEELLFGAFERSQLYELFCLLWQLNSFKKAGLHCVKVDHYDYAFLSKLKQSQLPNTFYFERKDDQGNLCKLTLFYEPAINAPGDTLPRCENGVELMRTSPLAIDQEAENFQLKHIQSPENLFYTPDFVVRTENAKGKVTWFISDAKYSDYKTVMKERTPEIVLKYLFSTAPVVTNEDVAGVWLFYHWKNSSFLLKSAQLWNPTHRPDVHYEHVQISDMEGSSQWINSVLESLN